MAALAEIVMRKLLDAPASQWEPLGTAMGRAFDAREALAWSKDPQVASVLAERRWDGAFPAHAGDFYFNSEFEYAAKNGRGIRRVYDHRVRIGPDGSGRVTTLLTLTNTEPPDPAFNNSTLAYHTIYGPEGGRPRHHRLGRLQLQGARAGRPPGRRLVQGRGALGRPDDAHRHLGRAQPGHSCARTAIGSTRCDGGTCPTTPATSST